MDSRKPKYKIDNLTSKAGQYDNSWRSKDVINDLIKTYKFHIDFNIFGHLDDALLNYNAGKVVTRKATEKQTNERFKKIIDCSNDLISMLNNLHENEYFIVQKAIVNKISSDPMNPLKPLGYFDEVKEALFRVNRVQAATELALTEHVNSKSGRPQKETEKRTIYQLLNIFELGTGKRATSSWSDLKDSYCSEAIGFCEHIFNSYGVNTIFTNQLIGETAKEYIRTKKGD
jgi:hypothetical protein